MNYLARADLLLLLSEMLCSPSSWNDGAREISEEDLDALARRSGLDGVPSGGEALRCAVAAWRATDLSAAHAECARLFDGAMVCPANETVYIRRDKGAILADIAGFYRAFGFELSEEFRDKHDHIVVELQFVALLLVLLGRAADAGHDEHREVARDALVRFIDDHLGAWIYSFTERMAHVAALPFYAEAAGLVALSWQATLSGLGIEREAEALPMLDEPGTPYECGMG